MKARVFVFTPARLAILTAMQREGVTVAAIAARLGTSERVVQGEIARQRRDGETEPPSWLAVRRTR